MNRDLRSIYEEDGRLPDMSRIDRRSRTTLLRWFGNAVIVILLITGIIWFAFSIFIPSGGNSDVTVSINAPAEAKALSKVSFRIRYENQDRNPLAFAALRVRYPREFSVDRTSPSADDDTNTSWTLGTIPKNGTGEIEVEGFMRADIGSSPELQASLTYKPANFNAEFTRVATHSFTIANSPVEVGIDAPEEVAAGQSVPITIRYKNSGEDMLENLKLAVTLPASFMVGKSVPAPTKDQEWTISKLNPGQEGEIALEGSFASEAIGVNPMRVSVKMASRRDLVLVANSEHAFNVTQGRVVVRLRVGEEEKSTPLGATLPLTISIENEGDKTVSDLELTMKGDSPLLDWDSAVSNKVVKVGKGTLVWNSKDNETLRSIQPKEKKEITGSMRLISHAATTIPADLTFSASLRVGRIGDAKTNAVVKSSIVALKANTDFQIQSAGRYYDDTGAVLGAGPLPPTVGAETKYRITWTLKNSYHEISNVALQAPLGENVSFGGKLIVGAGTLRYLPDTKTVRWEINRLPTSVGELTATFEVAATPQEQDRGMAMTLLGQAKGSADDSVTKESVQVSASSITSTIANDVKATGKGVVQ